MDKAGNILGGILERHNIRKIGALANIAADWRQVCGETVARHCAPADLRDGVLSIVVDSPAWMQQLSFLKAELLEKLQTHGIEDIRFTRGKLPGSSGMSRRKTSGRRRTVKPEDAEFIEKCGSAVEDDGLRGKLAELMRVFFSNARK
jgi:predicted nucleic acid-binding Zn ribbon protein